MWLESFSDGSCKQWSRYLHWRPARNYQVNSLPYSAYGFHCNIIVFCCWLVCAMLKAIWYNQIWDPILALTIDNKKDPLPPSDGAALFFSWWSDTTEAALPCLRKRFATLTIITAWALWKHMNSIIFDGLRPSSEQLISTIKDEAKRWAPKD